MNLFIVSFFLLALLASIQAQICLDPFAILVKDKSKCLIPMETLPNIEAMQTCAAKDGELLVINNNRELKSIIKALVNFGYYGIWVNAKKTDTDTNRYKWGNGKPFPGQLEWCENSTKNEDCTILLCAYGEDFNVKNCCLTDRECLTPFASICSINAM
jgi:hypothetical protein